MIRKTRMKQNRFAISYLITPIALLIPFTFLALWQVASRAAEPPQQVHFTDVTAAAGIHFSQNAGRTGKKWLPETMGSGVAFLDADGDGKLDILLINGSDWIARGRHTTAALYRNNGNGTFTDITLGSGFDIDIHGMGAAVGDYDNDGKDDVYV